MESKSIFFRGSVVVLSFLVHSGDIAGWNIHHLDGTRKNGVSIPASDLFARGYLFVFICKKQKLKKKKKTCVSLLRLVLVSSFLLFVFISICLAKIIQESLRVVSKSSAIS